MIALLAVAAGLCFPATVSSMRVLTAALVEDDALRMSDYALLAVSFGLAMIAGPLLVSAVLVVSGPATAVALAGAVLAVGSVGFALTPAARGWRSTRPSRSSGQRSAGLRPGLRTLLVGNSALGFAAGATSVALPAAVLAQGRPGLAGVGFAAMAVGDGIGGRHFGRCRAGPSLCTECAPTPSPSRCWPDACSPAMWTARSSRSVPARVSGRAR